MPSRPPQGPRGPILVVLHQEHSCPARVGRLLAQMGHALDMRRPRFGEPLPATLAGYDGAVVFGGPMSANDPDDFVKREIEFTGVALKEDKPFLGICLGAQMLARQLGQRVGPHAAGEVEIGYYPVTPTQDGARLCEAPFPSHFYQWHREGFDLPRGATLLAQGETFPVQAYSIGKAVGLQFHPEATYSTICRWTTRGAERMNAPGAQPRHVHLEAWHRYDAAVERWISDFLRRWISGAAPMALQSARMSAQ
jgi:GMP synthase (glutamine-hydrolysing)